MNETEPVNSALYDDIAPIHNADVSTTIDLLLADPGFQQAVSFIIPKAGWEQFCALMRTFKTKKDFQSTIISAVVHGIVEKTASEVTSGGWENISKTGQHLFLSNHRDIILDAGILNILRLDHGMDTTEIGIGDNLFVYPWIERLVRLNKSFVVKRAVTGRQMFLVSKHLAEYIHYIILHKNESVWLAQREGRAKDSNDKTQESLLKMLSMAPDDLSFIDSLKQLNILPLSLSYEYDPCDYLKAAEFQLKRDLPDYKKTQRDDLLNMERGMLGFKGHIHFQFAEPVNECLDQIALQEPDRKKQVPMVAACIDRQVHLHYKIFAINYIAYDKLYGENRFKEEYTTLQAEEFENYLRQQIDKIDIENKDEVFLRQRFLEMYSNTLKNYLAAKQQ